ncbi:UNVERIFIED_CONTAM: hypothetical protein Scaly_2156100 [Sesamum calycinum]|uniref:CRAL-TRIO domain-containing protein n=1 Tax=Sesamum calycinum TaxID=2727403 RepID=A0AAW2MR36_9LAMI
MAVILMSVADYPDPSVLENHRAPDVTMFRRKPQNQEIDTAERDTKHEVAHEGETGKVSKANFHDRKGRTVLIMRPGKQVVKYFVDQKTFQKINFVYPNNKDSLEVMKSFFDSENLPSEFGGKATLKYDHEEFSRLMAEDDVKTDWIRQKR